MIRKREQGISIVGFLIVSAILGVLLVGGIYTIRKTGWFSATNSNSVQTSKISSNNNHSAPNSTHKVSQGTDQGQGTTSGASSNPVSSDTQPPQASGGTLQAGGQTAVDSSSTNLPTTGPDDVVAQLISLGSIVAAITAYITSRHDVASHSSL